jgi:hypothetical protein
MDKAQGEFDLCGGFLLNSADGWGGGVHVDNRELHDRFVLRLIRSHYCITNEAAGLPRSCIGSRAV